jgi:putative flippase GtrA
VYRNKNQTKEVILNACLKHKTLKRIFKFCVGGGLGVLTAYITLYMLTEIFHVWYVASAVVSSILNYTVNFIVQKFWTFENKDLTQVRRQAILYYTMGAVFLPSNAGLLYVLVEFAHIPYMASQIILTVVFSIISYFITHSIFKSNTSNSQTRESDS